MLLICLSENFDIILFGNRPEMSEGRQSFQSLDSSRLSQLTYHANGKRQIKNLEAKLLMDFYNDQAYRKKNKYDEENSFKKSYGEAQTTLTQDYLRKQQEKKRKKAQMKQKLAEEYDDMIARKYHKQHQEREKTIQLERKDLQMHKWGRDNREDIIKRKKMQIEYGKQLENHIHLQEMKKRQQYAQEQDNIQRYKSEQQKQNLSYDSRKISEFEKRREFENRQNKILGVSNPEFETMTSSMDFSPKNFQALKRQQQLAYGSGLEEQLRSQTLSPRYGGHSELENFGSRGRNLNNSSNLFSERVSMDSPPNRDVYNPITNPIQINYKNPYVLKMLARNS